MTYDEITQDRHTFQTAVKNLDAQLFRCREAVALLNKIEGQKAKLKILQDQLNNAIESRANKNDILKSKKEVACTIEDLNFFLTEYQEFKIKHAL